MDTVASGASSRPAFMYLERIDDARRMSRFYSICVQQTLFGEWAVIYQWGRIGCRGQRLEHWLDTAQQASAASERKLAQKLRGGYVALA